MGKKNDFDFDYIVIGSGPAGAAAATLAAKAKLRVAIVESGCWGGRGLSGYEISSKASAAFSHAYSGAVSGSRFGISSRSLRFNYPTALNWQTLVEKRAGFNDKKFFTDAGITCYHGFANFLSPYELSVGSKRISASRFLIASGSTLSDGNINGVEQVICLTPESALRVSRLPKSVFIAGAGSTGCELAEHFASLGVKVYLGEIASSVLPREDEEAGKILGLYLEERLGVKILTQSRVISVEQEDSGKRITFLRGGAEKSVIVDELILATGSKPFVDLGLENTGVRFTSAGITVNSYLQTSVKHIYAAGDVLGRDNSSSELASYEGALATTNLISRTRNMASYSGYIRSTNTLPSVSSVGFSERECLRRHLKIKKSLVALSSIPASNLYDFRAGFVKIIAEKSTNKILGATIVCPDSDIVIQEISFAIRHGLDVIRLASTPHAASSWSEAVRVAARKLVK